MAGILRPLKYLALGSLLTATATPTTIAQAAAVFPGVGLPFPNFVGTVGQMFRAYPRYGTIGNPWADLGLSTDHVLETALSRRYANGFTFSQGYTFSKELDNLLGTPATRSTRGWRKRPVPPNRTHVFTGAWVYALPFGAGRRINPGNAVAHALVSDWTISGIASYSSGAPLSIPGSNCTSGNILGSCFPNYSPSYSGTFESTAPMATEVSWAPRRLFPAPRNCTAQLVPCRADCHTQEIGAADHTGKMNFSPFVAAV